MLISLNIVVYLFSTFYASDIFDIDIETLVLEGALYTPYMIQDSQWWRLITSMFLHGGITHIAMNMFSLYVVGRATQMYFDLKSYISIYIFSGLVGGLTSMTMHPHGIGVGASGAIFGLFGALAGFFLAHRKQIGSHSIAFMKEFAIIIGINLAIGLAIPSVDLSAHISGLIVGVFGGFFISKNPKLFLFYWSFMILFIVLWISYLSY